MARQESRACRSFRDEGQMGVDKLAEVLGFISV